MSSQKDTYSRYASRYEQLITEGEKVVRECWRGNEWVKSPGADAYVQFRTEALNLVRRTCGVDSDHYSELNRIATSNATALNDAFYRHCLGALKAAHRDFTGGYIADLRALVAADVFDDFLDQASHLFDHGYLAPAASLAGAVLEDALRELCSSHKIPLPQRTSIDKLNAQLAKAGVYDKSVLKRITSLADIRNSADHGHFDQLSPEDVGDMLKWVRRFAADFLM